MDTDARVLSFPYSHEIRSVTGKLGLFSLVMKMHHFLRKAEVNFILALSEKACQFREVVDQTSLTLNNKYVC